ncbi:hypothetical protein [Collimonas fungivorans]|uniref:hypothetical protein n=1 Tax=Collimonas fungivorans TaxID=158899 RepID=UPI003FA35B76
MKPSPSDPVSNAMHRNTCINATDFGILRATGSRQGCLPYGAPDPDLLAGVAVSGAMQEEDKISAGKKDNRQMGKYGNVQVQQYLAIHTVAK